MAKDVKVSLKGDSKSYQDSLKGADKANKAFADSVDKTQKIAAAAFAATAASILLAANRFSEFDDEFSKLTSRFVKDGEIQVETLEKIKGAVFDTSIEFGISAERMTEETLKLLDAGLGVDKSLKLVNEAAKLNIATGQDLSAITDIQAQAFLLYGDQIKDVSTISTVLFALQKQGVSSIEDLAGAMDKGLNAGLRLGSSFEETTALIASFQNISEQASKGFGAFADALITKNGAIGKVSAEAAVLLSKQSIEQIGLNESVRRAEAVLNKQGASLSDFINTGAAAATVTAFLADKNNELGATIASVTEKVSLQNDLNAVLAARQESLTQKTAVMKAAFDKITILLGEKLVPIITDLIDFFIKFAEALDDPEFIEYVATVLKITAGITGLTLVVTTSIKIYGLFTAAIALAAKAKVAGAVAARGFGVAIRFMLGPIGLAITAVTLLVGALAFWKSTSDDAAIATDKLTESLGGNVAALDEKKLAIEEEIATLEERQARLGELDEEDAQRLITAKEKLSDIEDEALAKTTEREETARANKKKVNDQTDKVEIKTLTKQEKDKETIDILAIQNKIDRNNAQIDGLSTANLTFFKRQQDIDLEFKKLSLDADTKHGDEKRALLVSQQAVLDNDRKIAMEKEIKEAQETADKKTTIDNIFGDSKIEFEKTLNDTIGSESASALDSLFGNNKDFQAVTVTGEGIVAVARALATPFPGNIPLAIATAVKAAANVAAIKGLSFAHGGIVPGGTNFDSQLAITRPGEFIAPVQDAEAAALGIARSRGFTPPGEGVGGGVTINVNVDGSIIGVGSDSEIAEQLAEFITPAIRDFQEINNGENLF